MPNHVYNNLIVKGKKDELEKFKQENSGTETFEGKTHNLPIDFNKTVSQPPEVGDEEVETGIKLSNGEHCKMPAWYVWRLANWGTKWNAYEQEEEHTEEELHYRFETAWSPPQAWFKKLAEKYPNLKIELWFEEEAHSYPDGKFVATKGKFREQKVACKYNPKT